MTKFDSNEVSTRLIYMASYIIQVEFPCFVQQNRDYSPHFTRRISTIVFLNIICCLFNRADMNATDELINNKNKLELIDHSYQTLLPIVLSFYIHYLDFYLLLVLENSFKCHFVVKFVAMS